MRYISTLITGFIIAIFGLALMSAFNVALPLTITTQQASELSVVGEGKVDVVPDTAYIDVGITINDAQTSKDAQNSIGKTNNAIIAAMNKLGVKKEDIKTSNYSVYPNYSYEANGNNKLLGYSGNVTITIKVKDTQKASQVIEAATAAGANQIQGTRFVVEDPQKYRDEARSMAIANAKEQAQKLAKSLDIKLGKVVNVVENSPDSSIMPMYSTASNAKELGGGGGAPVIESGTQTITSVVTLYFEKR